MKRHKEGNKLHKAAKSTRWLCSSEKTRETQNSSIYQSIKNVLVRGISTSKKVNVGYTLWTRDDYERFCYSPNCLI